MKKEAKLWVDLAKEDFQDMNYMRKEKRYRGAVLFAQQAVEPLLKMARNLYLWVEKKLIKK